MPTRPIRQDPLGAYAAAVAKERAAWEAVRNTLPGSPGFDHELWRRWRCAVEESDEAAADAKAAVAKAPKERQTQSPFFGKPWPETVRLPSLRSGRPPSAGAR